MQEIVLQNLKDPEIYHPASRGILKEYLSETGFALGVVADDGLIGFGCIHIPGDEQENLGRDIGLSIEDLNKVAQLQFSFIHPDYRGYSLQYKLIKYFLDVIKDTGYLHVLCTVSPKNYHSLHNAFQRGFLIKEIKEKFDGLLRCIMYKDLSTDANPALKDVVRVRSSDIEGQKKLLSEGFFGFNASKGPDEFFIHYGRSRS